MEKSEITVAFDHTRLEALEFYLKKENSSVQKRMDESLRHLYESTVPEPSAGIPGQQSTPGKAKASVPAQSAEARTAPRGSV